MSRPSEIALVVFTMYLQEWTFAELRPWRFPAQFLDIRHHRIDHPSVHSVICHHGLIQELLGVLDVL